MFFFWLHIGDSCYAQFEYNGGAAALGLFGLSCPGNNLSQRFPFPGGSTPVEVKIVLWVALTQQSAELFLDGTSVARIPFTSTTVVGNSLTLRIGVDNPTPAPVAVSYDDILVEQITP